MSKISERIRYVGVNDCEKSLFEGIWPLPFGISYNSYLIVGKKIALIDTIDEGFEKQYLEKIRDEIGSRTIDYLIINHMEPDHSSLISLILDIYPGILVVADAKALPMLKGYYGLSEDDVLIVRDSDKLNLGDCELIFHMAPMVHWPETMMTWLPAEKTLFSGDAFGSFGALKHGITDTEYSCCTDACTCDEGCICRDGTQCQEEEIDDETCDNQEIEENKECTHYSSEHFCHGKADAFEMYRSEMIRYYSNIIGKYGGAVQTALKKISNLPLERVCSSHGPVWEKHVQQVIGLYDSLSRYEAEPGVCIVYGTMYGNTAEAARNLERELSLLGIPTALHNMNVENGSAALRDVFRYSTLAVGSPTYNGGIFPPIESFMRSVTSRMVKGRGFFAFGSYTWAAASVRMLNDIATSQGFCLLHDGLTFPQAWSADKCDMKEIARLLASKMTASDPIYPCGPKH